jgi:hypothetical protein
MGRLVLLLEGYKATELGTLTDNVQRPSIFENEVCMLFHILPIAVA